jgi:hypothetical protein
MACGPQFDILFGPTRVDEGHERVLPKDAPQRSGLDRLATVKDNTFGRTEVRAQIAVAMSFEEEIDRDASHLEHTLEQAALKGGKAQAVLYGLTDEAYDIIDHFHEVIGLARCGRS